MWSWGNGAGGRLGLGDVISKSSPVQVGALTTWAQVAAGREHNLALKTDGTLWAWGDGANGRLGNNISPTIDVSSPVQIGALTTWSQVAAGNSHSLAIKTDGTMWSWGDNAVNGRLGLNDIDSRSSPVQIGALTTWSQVSGGSLHSLAIKTDGTMWSWGVGTFGQTGLGDTISQSSPVQVGALTTWSQLPKMPLASHTLAITRE